MHNCTRLRRVMASREPEQIAVALVNACVYTSLPWRVSEAALQAAWLKIVFCELAPCGGWNKTSSEP